MQETEKYKLKKPDAEDFFNISDFNENTNKIEQALGENAAGVQELKTPPFDDSGTAEGINSFTDFIAKVKSKMNIFEFFKNFKAGLKFIVHTGMIVDNYVTEEKGFIPDATLITNLKKQLDEQNNNFNTSLTELKKSVADGKNLIGNVVGGNQDSTFQVLANNAQSIKNSMDSLNSQLSAMTADRDNWMNIANSRPIKQTYTGSVTFNQGERKYVVVRKSDFSYFNMMIIEVGNRYGYLLYSSNYGQHERIFYNKDTSDAFSVPSGFIFHSFYTSESKIVISASSEYIINIVDYLQL